MNGPRGEDDHMRIGPVISAIAAAIALGATTADAAPISWDLVSGSCSNSGSGNGNTRTCSGGSGAPSVTASAWANTGGSSNTIIQDALLSTYSGGLGVRNRDVSSGDTDEDESPEHAIDNQDRFDSVKFSFTEAVTLTSVDIGWYDDDSDLTVLAYTGAGAPALAGSTYGSLLSSGWTFIGHYENAGTGWEGINAGGIFAEHWLVGAYNHTIGIGSSSKAGNDNIKIEQLQGEGRSRSGTGSVSVPEPATLALVGAGLLGLVARRRAGTRHA
jgi:hypothetical protein